MTDTTARMVEAEQAALAVKTYLKPALTLLRAEYGLMHLDIMQELERPEDTDRARKLALAMKVLNKVEQHLMGIILDGKIAQHKAERASEMADLTTDQRRWYEFGGGR